MRNKKILRGLDKKMNGLEIGPCHRPAAPKRDGWNCISVDHADRIELVRKYREHAGVDVNEIEEVDVVWTRGELSALFPHGACFDYIIASHVIEHTPDFVGFLQSCEKLLAPNGVLSLVVPDKRYCFDRFRPISTTGQIIQSHLDGRNRHSFSTIFDEKAYACNVDGEICWDRWASTTRWQLNHAFNDAFAEANQSIKLEHYVDAHAWCFVPSSFRLILQDLNELGFSSLRELVFFDTEFCEFFVQLGVKGHCVPVSRLEMLMRIQAELGN